MTASEEASLLLFCVFRFFPFIYLVYIKNFFFFSLCEQVFFIFLVICTGQQEVNSLVRKLRRAFPKKTAKTKNTDSIKQNNSLDTEGNNDTDEEEMDMEKAIQNARKAKRKRDKEIPLPEINLDNYSIMPGDDTEIDLLDDDDLGDLQSDEETDQLNLKGLSACQPMWVLPLYSLLPSDKQALVSVNNPSYFFTQWHNIPWRYFTAL